jgi:hypothetical protein
MPRLFFRYKISPEELEFIRLNKKNWNINHAKDIGVLVEGFLDSPTSIVEKSRLANAAREVTGLDVKVIVRGFKKQASNVVPIYESFGLIKFYFWWRNYLNPFILFPSFLSFIYIFIAIKDGEKLVNYKKGNVLIGDLIYDSLIRNIPRSYTVNRLSVFKHGRLIFRSMVFYFGNKKLLNDSDIKVVVTSHNVYAEYGMLCRQAHSKGAIVLLKDMDVYKVYGRKSNITEHFLKIDNGQIAYEYKHSDLVKEKDYFQSRVLGLSDQIDVKNAYKDKRVYTAEETVQLHDGFSASKKSIFVMAHAFSDAPHVGEGLLFKDYYDFLEKTLIKLNLNKNINCFVKSHPSSYMWSESGAVEEIIKNNGLFNISVLPSDFSTASIIDMADVIVTAKGTAGLEFSCAGIPAITAGKGYYHGFGICHEPETIDIYYQLLSNCQELKRLDRTKMRLALIVLYQSFNRLFHSDILPAVQIRPGDDYHALFKSKFDEMNGKIKRNITMKDDFYFLVKEDVKRAMNEK